MEGWFLIFTLVKQKKVRDQIHLHIFYYTLIKGKKKHYPNMFQLEYFGVTEYDKCFVLDLVQWDVKNIWSSNLKWISNISITYVHFGKN